MTQANVEILKKIREGLSIEQLERLIKDQKTSLPIFLAALQGYDRYRKLIERYQQLIDPARKSCKC